MLMMTFMRIMSTRAKFNCPINGGESQCDRVLFTLLIDPQLVFRFWNRFCCCSLEFCFFLIFYLIVSEFAQTKNFVLCGANLARCG